MKCRRCHVNIRPNKAPFHLLVLPSFVAQTASRTYYQHGGTLLHHASSGRFSGLGA
jgi:hypothetical protein